MGGLPRQAALGVRRLRFAKYYLQTTYSESPGNGGNLCLSLCPFQNCKSWGTKGGNSRLLRGVPPGHPQAPRCPQHTYPTHKVDPISDFSFNGKAACGSRMEHSLTPPSLCSTSPSSSTPRPPPTLSCPPRSCSSSRYRTGSGLAFCQEKVGLLPPGLVQFV